MTLWRTLLAWLASLAADPATIDAEPPRAAAAVAAAYATLVPEEAPQPPPAPDGCACGGRCQNGTYKPDGRIVMQCEKDCSCGCRKPKSVLAPGTTAAPCPTCKPISPAPAR